MKEARQFQQKEEEELFLAWKTKELDKVAQNELALRQITQNKTDLNEKYLMKQMEIDAINKEQLRRDLFASENLDNALKKADIIAKKMKQDDYDLRKKAQFAENLISNTQDAKYRIAHEIEALRGRELQDMEQKKQQQLRSLNLQRAKLMEEQEQVARKKIAHQKLINRGVEFLASLELGYGPSRQQVMSNMEAINIQPDLYDINVQQEEYKAQNELNLLEEKLQKLNIAKRITILEIEMPKIPYDGRFNVRKEGVHSETTIQAIEIII